MGLKIATIGAGSSYTPDFAEMMIALKEQIPVSDWFLMDIDQERLDIVGNFTKAIIDDAKLPVNVVLTTDLVEAVKDADFVITTMRVGVARGRVLDESIPTKHGLIGQETTAPGGLAMGLRNVPVIVNVAKMIEEHAKPEAWLINLANPGGMLTEAVNRETNCKVAGLCNWPSMMWKMLAKAYGISRDRVFMKFVGINHLNWGQPYVDGKPVGSEGREKLFKVLAQEMGGGAAFSKMFLPNDISDFSGWPLSPPYNRYYYMLDDVNFIKPDYFSSAWEQQKKRLLAETKISPEVLDQVDFSKITYRAEMVEVLDGITMELYREKDMNGFRLVQGTRGGGGYGAAGFDVINAIYNNLNDVQIVDTPNKGSIEGIPHDWVVQIPCLINGVGIFPVAMGEIPHHMQAFLQAAKRYELLAVDAAMNGDYKIALEALITNPLIMSFNKAKAALDELLIAHKENLPNFAGVIELLEKGGSLY